MKEGGRAIEAGFIHMNKKRITAMRRNEEYRVRYVLLESGSLVRNLEERKLATCDIVSITEYGKYT